MMTVRALREKLEHLDDDTALVIDSVFGDYANLSVQKTEEVLMESN